MLKRFRNRAPGPLEWAAILLVGLALLAAVGAVVVDTLRTEKCGGDLEWVSGQCVGVTAVDPHGDPELDGLVEAVAEENARVEQAWQDPKDGIRVPFVRIALMMPYTSNATSTMSIEQIQRALAGAHAAQLEANSKIGPNYQLLMAPNGLNLEKWESVVDDLVPMADDDEESPLVGVFGAPSSTPETQNAAKALSAHEIPTVGPIVTSTDMSADYFFKTSASNDAMVRALEAYLESNPGRGEGFLVADDREKDKYSLDLRELFQERFPEYDLRQRMGTFTGQTGKPKGKTRRFPESVRKLCAASADTIFFAGRDHDLEFLINRLVEEPDCTGETETRILKVGIGMEPTLTKPSVTQTLRDNNITLVNAASVFPGWWAKNPQGDPPEELEDFRERFKDIKLDDMGDSALDDGYAIMYYDAFTTLAKAVDVAYDALPGDNKMPTKHDVYQSLINMNIVPGEDGAECDICVQGASGTFGFDDALNTDRWAVCKAVPVMVYPGDPDSDTLRQSGPTYRTYEDLLDKGCP